MAIGNESGLPGLSTTMGHANRIRLIADTISGRLALVFALLILPPTLLSLYFAWNSFTEQKARAKLQVRQFATLTATYESKFFEDARKTLQHLANEPVIRDGGGGAACNAALEAALKRTQEFASIGFFDVEGRRICGSRGELADMDHGAWLRDVRRFRSFAISDYAVMPDSSSPVIVAALATYGANGQFQGVLAAWIRLFWLSAFIREVSLPAESVFYLIDGNGNVLADRAAILSPPSRLLSADPGPAPLLGSGSLADVVGPELSAAILSRRLNEFESIGQDNIRRVFSSVALPHGDATVLFGMPAITTFGWVEKDLFYRVMGLAAIVFAGVGAAVLGTRFLVTRWMTSLRGMARAYGQGDFAPKPAFGNAPREIRDLGETLAAMAQRIEMREDELRASLIQKDTVLREIHHRVKNNLQIVSSLLRIRGGSVATGIGQAALSEVEAHVRALALVHRHLYENDDVDQVDLRSFMTELCQSTLAGLSSPAQRISLEIDIPEFTIAIDRAIAIALLVTEAMTNSLKHAFPNGRRGRIRVVFARDGASGTLIVADDGIGMPPASREAGGIGIQLIHAFAKQIDGQVIFSGPPGTTIRVEVGSGMPSGRSDMEPELLPVAPTESGAA